MEKNKKKGSNIKGIIVAVFLVVIVLLYFNHLSNRSSKRRTQQEASELQQLMEYDMTLDYPNTPRDLAKLHNRYFKAFYGQTLSDDELETLNEKVRNLYCSDLLMVNAESIALDNLKKNIEDMREEGYVYKRYILPEASQVQTFTRNGREMAMLEVTVVVNTGKDVGYRYVEYIMVKEDNVWKIYGWGDVQNMDSTEPAAD